MQKLFLQVFDKENDNEMTSENAKVLTHNVIKGFKAKLKNLAKEQMLAHLKSVSHYFDNRVVYYHLDMFYF